MFVSASDTRRNLANNRDKLRHFIDPDNGLLEQFEENKVFSLEQIKAVRNGRTVKERNDLILDYISKVDDDDHIFDIFLSFYESSQRHVCWLLTSSGGDVL